MTIVLFYCPKVAQKEGKNQVFYERVTFEKKVELFLKILLTPKNRSGIIRLTINATDCISDVIFSKCCIL